MKIISNIQKRSANQLKVPYCADSSLRNRCAQVIGLQRLREQYPHLSLEAQHLSCVDQGDVYHVVHIDLGLSTEIPITFQRD